jgi:hypothetical protein
MAQEATRLVNRFDTRLTGDALARQPFAFLDRVDLSACLQVCHRWQHLAEPAFWEQIRQSLVPSIPRLPVETLQARCVTRLNTIEANIQAGRSELSWQPSETSLKVRSYYSRLQRELFVTVKNTTIEVRDFRTREIQRSLDCSELSPFWKDRRDSLRRVVHPPAHDFVGMAQGQLVLIAQTERGKAICCWKLKEDAAPIIRHIADFSIRDDASVIDDQVVYLSASQNCLIVMDLFSLREFKRIPCEIEGIEEIGFSKLSGQNGKVIVSTRREMKVFNLRTSAMEDRSTINYRMLTTRAGGMWVSHRSELGVGGRFEFRDRLRLSEPPVRSIPASFQDAHRLIPFRNTILYCGRSNLVTSYNLVSYNLATGEHRVLTPPPPPGAPHVDLQQLQFHDGVLRFERKSGAQRTIAELDFNLAPPAPPEPPEEAPVPQAPLGVFQSFLNCLLDAWNAITACVSGFVRNCLGLA